MEKEVFGFFRLKEIRNKNEEKEKLTFPFT